MNPSHPNRNERGAEQAAVINLFLFLVHSHATSVAIFLRRDFGVAALAGNSLMAMLMLYVMATQDLVFLTYLAVFTLMQIYRRIETHRRIWRGEMWHSLYPGYPYVALRLQKVADERKAIEVVEPLICFAVGGAFLAINELLALYVMIAGVSLIVRNGVINMMDRKRIQKMYDARIEHEWYSNQMRR